MRINGMSDARLALVEKDEHSSVKATLRSVREFEEYLESSMRRSLLSDTIAFTEVVGHIVVDAD